MKLLYFVTILWLLAQGDCVLGRSSFGGSDVLNSFTDIVKGVGKEIANIIPTPEELFKVSKQVLFGLPEVAVFKTINNLCKLKNLKIKINRKINRISIEGSIYLASDTINPRITPDMASMTLRLRTPCQDLSFSLSEVEDLLASDAFDVNKKVAIFVHGWMASTDSDYVAEMANAFNCRGGYNFLVCFKLSNKMSVFQEKKKILILF